MDDLPAEQGDPFAIDPNAARLARVENFLAGGDSHFAVDRAAAESIGEVSPGGIEGLQGLIGVVKAFVERAVTVLSGQLGMRQYLHIGMSTPTTGMVHHLAAKIAPDTRVVYASYDPTTLAHVHELQRDVEEGSVAHVHSTFDDPQRILGQAAVTLDLAQPVAVVLPTTLNLITDDAVAERIVAELHAAMAPGSYLAFAHTSLDFASKGTAEAIERFNEILDEGYAIRTKAQIARLLEGFELIEPGLVPIEEWRPDDPTVIETRRRYPVYGAVGSRR